MPLTPAVSSKDHIQGSLDAPIVLVEFGDYQCPYCGQFYYTMKKIQKTMGDKLAFVFRNFPLSMHPNALPAAIAAEVMHKYGKFWPMHDILYENQDHLGNNYLLEYAKKLGVSEEDFKKDFSDTLFLDKVHADLKSGEESGVDGTPSIFINGQKYDGEHDYDTLIAVLQQND